MLVVMNSPTPPPLTRRTCLRRGGLVVVGSLTAFAGCQGDPSDTTATTTGTSTPTSTPTTTSTPTETPTETETEEATTETQTPTEPPSSRGLTYTDVVTVPPDPTDFEVTYYDVPVLLANRDAADDTSDAIDDSSVYDSPMGYEIPYDDLDYIVTGSEITLLSGRLNPDAITSTITQTGVEQVESYRGYELYASQTNATALTDETVIERFFPDSGYVTLKQAIDTIAGDEPTFTPRTRTSGRSSTRSATGPTSRPASTGRRFDSTDER